MDIEKEVFETWLHSSQPVCKSPSVCWDAGLVSDETTRALAGTRESEEAFRAWQQGVIAHGDGEALFQAYCAALDWGRRNAQRATNADMSYATERLDGVRPLRL